ncbi:hypothetical protein ACJW30_09G146100 [Castanea mollissima]
MASRPIVPPQPRGEAGVGGAKQQPKKNVAGDARNRRALGDIGNVATVRGIEGKPNRPITRSFCAQLLANAQAAAAAENNKKQVCVNVDAGKKAGGAPKPPQKKATVKPKPVEVIDISPDTQEDDAKPKQENIPVIKKKDGEARSGKKAHAFSSVLTARSKAACGLTNKPKEQIIDIDAADVGNDLAAVEYIEDIYKFYKLVENESRPHDYIDSQPEINEIDRFLAIKIVSRRELQLVGISAMLMASKYEEIWPPEVNDFVHLSDRAYTHEQVLTMEKTILGKLEWTLTVPTPYVFLARFIKASIPDKELESMVYFLAELGIMHYTIKYCPSMIAASAVYAARCTLKKTPTWNETLKRYTGFSEPQLMDCAKQLVSFHAMAVKSKLQAVYRKYSNPERGAVSLLPPAALLL